MELLVIWLVFGAIVGVIAHHKGYDGVAWGFYGVLLWPVALVHILVKPRSALGLAKAQLAAGRRPCPFCAEEIKVEAKVCPHCQRDLPLNWSAPPPA